MKHEQIIFLHIPKTAGTSLRNYIYQQYGDNRVASVYERPQRYFSVSDFLKLTLQEKNKLEVVIGHFEYGFHRHLVHCARPIRYATFVREPIKRCLSLYNHFANLSFRGDPPKFKEFLKSPIGLQFDNYQTRIISGCYPKFGQCNKAMLDIAIERIEREFALVGVTELFDESIIVATQKLDWQIFPYESRNMSSQLGVDLRGNLSSKGPNNDLNQLEQMNSLDHELYNYCKKKLLDDLETVAGWPAKLDSLKTMNAIQVSTISSIGCLAELREASITGWTRLKQRDSIATVKIVINERSEITTPANVKCSDLRSVDLLGVCGFQLNLPIDAYLKTGDQVRAWCVESGQELSNSPRFFQMRCENTINLQRSRGHSGETGTLPQGSRIHAT